MRAVDAVRNQLSAIAERCVAHDVDILVFPTALMVQAGEGESALVRLTSAAGGGRLRPDQVSAVYELAGHVQRGEVGLTQAAPRLGAILVMRPLFGTIARTLGLGLLAAGFASALQPTLLGWWGHSCSARWRACLVQGLMDLLLLAFGIIATAAVLVGAPSADLTDRPFGQLGSWTTVLALVVIALGNHPHLCAPRRAVPWILLVLGPLRSGRRAVRRCSRRSCRRSSVHWS